jgi:hypothetical protein
MAPSCEILAELAVQYWKLCAAFEYALADAGERASQSASAQLRYARSRLHALLERAGMELHTFDGEPWDAALPPAPLNSDAITGDAPIVERTIEPTIVAGGSIILPGKIMLKEA